MRGCAYTSVCLADTCSKIGRLRSTCMGSISDSLVCSRPVCCSAVRVHWSRCSVGCGIPGILGGAVCSAHAGHLLVDALLVLLLNVARAVHCNAMPHIRWDHRTIWAGTCFGMPLRYPSRVGTANIAGPAAVKEGSEGSYQKSHKGTDHASAAARPAVRNADGHRCTQRVCRRLTKHHGSLYQE